MKYHLDYSKEDPNYILLKKTFKIIGSHYFVVSLLNKFNNSRKSKMIIDLKRY
ncbi:hypothetical protein MSWAN_1385 [Methanobacterium paludis]|uniref:Uncharacterized protein n=1 Tax=Methanobacterium paludis (strain DSM 25820 / JCM 18151 / SWAN1) TaxID=868131 RepID=F6D732_METPW|nr:hypothetical protein MSWAN_1385 [Methanobacterium paludis]